MVCDRMDFDGITPKELGEAMRSGWREVEEVQSYAAACKTHRTTATQPKSYSVFDWWTHLGWCPDCAHLLD